MDHGLASLANPHVAEPWTAESRTDIERQIWLTVLREHVTMGVADPGALQMYRATADQVEPSRIREIEARTRHDVKAHIEAWNELAGYEQIHMGMTSADVVENAAQVQVQRSALALVGQINRYERSTSLRLAIKRSVERYPLRGIVGAVGTGLDQVELTGRRDAPDVLSKAVRNQFRFYYVQGSVGQTYPRSVDLSVASSAMSACSALGGDREMLAAASGYMQMLAGISGDQWNEGDVSSSVVRRVALPGFFLACSASLCV